MTITKGHCLCGAVTVSVTNMPGDISACHCSMCTRWSGSVQMGVAVKEADLTIQGPVKVFQSSAFAERAWCDTCGSALWLRSTGGPDAGYIEVVPGLFDNAAGAALTRVVYADQHPDAFWVEGRKVERVAKADYEAQFPFVEDDT